MSNLPPRIIKVRASVRTPAFRPPSRGPLARAEPARVRAIEADPPRSAPRGERKTLALARAV